MAKKRIRVRAVEGRIARTAPQGEFIPADRYIQVEATPYVMRLLNFHGDIEEQPTPVAATPQPAAPAKAPATTKEDK